MDRSERMLPGETLPADAQREISAGNLREGAGLVWRAAIPMNRAGSPKPDAN